MSNRERLGFGVLLACLIPALLPGAEELQRPYGAPCTEREERFEFASRPAVKNLGNDRYEITFAVTGCCDVTVGILDEAGKVVRHLASGVLGANAPAPFRKGSLHQTLFWNGKDDLDGYVKEPQRLQVRVSLGLKPEFDRVLGWNPHDVTGSFIFLAADEQGVLVLSQGQAPYARPQLRRYDHDGNYAKTVFPPSAELPFEKMKGLETLEYEPGKRTIHSVVGAESPATALSKAAVQNSSVSGYGAFLPPAGAPSQQQALISQGWLIYANTGHRTQPVWLHRMRAGDGASDDTEYAWIRLTRSLNEAQYFQEFTTSNIRLAASPDGKWIYLSGLTKLGAGTCLPGIYRVDAGKREPLGSQPFLGFENEPGNDNAHFNRPEGIDCDAQGRLYVCDPLNNRIQVFSPEGSYLRTLSLAQPHLIQIDRARGIPYVLQLAMTRGASSWRLSKLRSLEGADSAATLEIPSLLEGQRQEGEGLSHLLPPSEVGYQSACPLIALDRWSGRPRVWVTARSNRLFMVEDAGDRFTLLRDFASEVRRSGLPPGVMLARFPKVTADPVREKLYYYGLASSCSRSAYRFDLGSGAVEPVQFPYGYGDFGPDIGLDKRGYLLTHLTGKVMRHDPDQLVELRLPGSQVLKVMKEVPLDYGTAGEGEGAVATRDQGCAKGYQDGFGVNMRGDFAVESNIGYVPKLQDEAKSLVGPNQAAVESYAGFLRSLDEQIKRGEELYSIPQQPGIRLAGATFWTYEQTGELRQANLVAGLGLVHGLQLDEEFNLYFALAENKVVDGRPFLAGRGTHLGNPDRPSNTPTIGTLAKAAPGRRARVFSKKAPVRAEAVPDRICDLTGSHVVAGPESWRFDLEHRAFWAEGFEWLYAGASPIVPEGSCSCSNLRIHTDWYRRTYLPEAYRHSVGVVDTAGNLILHIGRYGNADSGRGAQSPVKVGGDEIAFAHVQYLSGTDTYLCLSDAGNARLVVLKLRYEVEASAPLMSK